MRPLWIFLAFLALMLLIGHGWQGDQVTAGVTGASPTVPGPDRTRP